MLNLESENLWLDGEEVDPEESDGRLVGVPPLTLGRDMWGELNGIP